LAEPAVVTARSVEASDEAELNVLRSSPELAEEREQMDAERFHHHLSGHLHHGEPRRNIRQR